MNNIKLFQEKQIRSVWNEEEQQWCFSVVDVVGVLTDSVNPTDYPELAQERMKELYEQKGYPKDWIDKRLRGIAIRQSLTDEWKERGITEKSDYAILTAEFLKQRLD